MQAIALILAAGKGTRMKPISDVFPKPLIPLNGKPMINHVIDYFTKYGINNYFLTLNYKSNLMISYFDSLRPFKEIEGKIPFLKFP